MTGNGQRTTHLAQGRAALLVQGRADIAGAAGAEGVLLGGASLPAVVARKSLGGAASIVAKTVTDVDTAKAAEKQGVDLLLLDRCVDQRTA